jgi:hypothetical protein
MENEKNDKPIQTAQALMEISPDISLEQQIKRAEKYLELMKRIRLNAIKLTSTMDWSNQGGKPYLEKSGCDKIASAFGMRISETTFEKEQITDDAGEYVLYTCSAHGAWNNVEASEVGTCSTRDDFFGKSGGKYKPLSEVDITDIKKKAFTNCMNRLVKRLLGLSFSWEELKELSENAISQETVQKVEFNSGKKGGNTDAPETKKLREEIRKMVLEMCDGEDSAAKKYLVDHTTFKGRDGNTVAGKPAVDALSEKQVTYLHKDVKREYDTWLKTTYPDGQPGGAA